MLGSRFLRGRRLLDVFLELLEDGRKCFDDALFTSGDPIAAHDQVVDRVSLQFRSIWRFAAWRIVGIRQYKRLLAEVRFPRLAVQLSAKLDLVRGDERPGFHHGRVATLNKRIDLGRLTVNL